MKVNEALSGIWLSLNEEQCRIVWDAVKADGYEPDTDGLKQWILDNATEEPEEEPETGTDRVLRGFESYLRNNPEEVQKYARMGQSLLNQAFSRIRGGK